MVVFSEFNRFSKNFSAWTCDCLYLGTIISEMQTSKKIMAEMSLSVERRKPK